MRARRRSIARAGYITLPFNTPSSAESISTLAISPGDISPTNSIMPSMPGESKYARPIGTPVSGS